MPDIITWYEDKPYPITNNNHTGRPRAGGEGTRMAKGKGKKGRKPKPKNEGEEQQ